MPPDLPASTISRIVSGGYWRSRGFDVGVKLPPEAMTLSTSAPSSTVNCACARTASGVSASPPQNQQWSIVRVIGAPAASRRGPGITPDAIASRTAKTTSFFEPRSRIVVIPERSASPTACAARISAGSFGSCEMMSKASTRGGQGMCVCPSTSPGIRETSPRSTVSAVGASAAGRMSTIVPPATPTAWSGSQPSIAAFATRAAL